MTWRCIRRRGAIPFERVKPTIGNKPRLGAAQKEQIVQHTVLIAHPMTGVTEASEIEGAIVRPYLKRIEGMWQ